MKRSTKRLRCERATRCRITSVSVVDCMIAPSRTSWRRSVRPLVRLPLWPIGEAAGIELGEQRLHVAQDRLAGGRIAHMADGGVAGQAVDHLAPGEGVADEAERGARNGTACRRRRRCRPPPGRDAASACRPSAVMAAASGWPKMPNTPHSSRSRSASRSRKVVSVMVIESRDPFLELSSRLLHAGRLDAIVPGYRRLVGRRVDLPMPVGASPGFRCPPAVGRFSRFKMVLSGSSGNMDISHSPVP